MLPFDTCKFIAEIKKRPALWNSYCQEYEHRKIQKKYWDEIIEIFSDNEVLDPTERQKLEKSLKQRWKSIRGSFTRELKRQIILKSGGVGVYKSEYVFYRQLLFLKKVIALKGPPKPMKPRYYRRKQKPKSIEPSPVEADELNDLDTNDLYVPTTEVIDPENVQEEDGSYVLLASALEKAPEDVDLLTPIVLLFTEDDMET